MTQITSFIPGVIAKAVDSQFASAEVVTPGIVPQTAPSSSGISSSGITLGQTRYHDEDTANLVVRQAVQQEIARITQTIAEIKEQPSTQSPVSAKQAVAQAINQTHISPTRTADATRALQKLQRTCNHRYDRSSKRCLYCTKHRDSHVYDTGSKSLLN